MNARQLYLAWVRSAYPMQYTQAIQRILGKPRNLGGLGDDLLGAMSPSVNNYLGQDIPTIDVTASPDSSPQLTTVDTTTFTNPTVSADNPDFTIDTSGATGIPDAFSAFTSAISNVAQTYLSTSAQQQLLAVNTARARQGLPPLTAGGVPVTAASLAPANSSVLALEKSIAGVASPSMLLFVALGVGALIMLGRKRG